MFTRLNNKKGQGKTNESQCSEPQTGPGRPSQPPVSTAAFGPWIKEVIQTK